MAKVTRRSVIVAQKMAKDRNGKDKRYREKHKEKVQAFERKRALATGAERLSKYRAENPEHILARDRAYRLANRDKIIARKREWRKRNRNQLRALDWMYKRGIKKEVIGEQKYKELVATHVKILDAQDATMTRKRTLANGHKENSRRNAQPRIAGNIKSG